MNILPEQFMIKVLFLSTMFLLVVYGNEQMNKNIEDIVEAVNGAGCKWNASHNFVDNITLSLMKMLLGVKEPSSVNTLLSEKYPNQHSEIPEEFDSRKRWPECESIRQIRNQGQCGSSWAVAAAATFTDRLCIATEGNFTEPLSAQELLGCCSNCGEGCDGGYPYEAWRFIAQNGVVTGGEYNQSVGCQPYEIEPTTDGWFASELYMDTPVCKKECTNPSYPVPYEEDHHKIRHVYIINEDVKKIQREIMNHGPVEASFTVYLDFMTYQSGIYHYVTGNVVGSHAVKMIGWGVEDGTPYWLLANEWGEDWGEDGFFRILRGENECDIEHEIVAGSV